MSHNPWTHILHAAQHSEHKNPVLSGIVYIVVGLFLAPVLVGVPILLYGIYKVATA